MKRLLAGIAIAWVLLGAPVTGAAQTPPPLRIDLVLSGDLEYWAYLATFGSWGFVPRVLLHVDGAQSAGPGLYDKFRRRYERCATMAKWEDRVTPRLKAADVDGFARARGRVATGYVFAKVFVGRDREAYAEARAHRHSLEGRYGRLWRVGTMCGFASWKLVAVAVRARTQIQYRAAKAATGGDR